MSVTTGFQNSYGVQQKMSTPQRFGTTLQNKWQIKCHLWVNHPFKTTKRIDANMDDRQLHQRPYPLPLRLDDLQSPACC